MTQHVFWNCQIATMEDGKNAYGLLECGALVEEKGFIQWVGPKADLPHIYSSEDLIDLGGRLLTPALIDCHTHLVHGGNRAQEFEMRLTGSSYEEVARAGGGIISTVSATRGASEDFLYLDALTRVEALMAEGVSTIEIKSGYGLDKKTELKMLRVARKIGEVCDIDVITSFLGAHAIPPEFKNRASSYISEVCLPTFREAVDEGLVDTVDAFCEGIAFQPSELVPLFDLARELGIPIKLHAEQLSNIGGAKLAADYGALSADHLEYLDKAGVVAMSAAGTIAVILPGAFYTLREVQKPPIEMFRKYKVPMAIATDSNPGSSPMTSLLLAMNMGCTLFSMTPEEVLLGGTRNAAYALGLKDKGTLQIGMQSDLSIWNVRHPAELSYRIGFNPLHRRIKGGKI